MMAANLSPAKVVLLAAQYTATASINQLASLTAQHGDVLRLVLILRLLLTYLPARLATTSYLPLLISLEGHDFSTFFPLVELDGASVDSLSEAQAAHKARQLRLRPLELPGEDLSETTTGETEDETPDHMATFLVLRAYAVDDGAGALPELPALVAPFFEGRERLQTWAVSTLLPLVRRNCEFYPERPLATTLADFAHLPDRVAVARLLSQTGVGEASASAPASVGRDLRGLVGPWLYNERRWRSRRGSKKNDENVDANEQHALCPGWEEALRWLTAQATQAATWRVAVAAVEQWDGPGDMDVGGLGTLWLDDREQRYLEQRYARAALAVVYLLPEASADALEGAYAIVAKMRGLLDVDATASSPHLAAAATLLPPISSNVVGRTISGSSGSPSPADMARALSALGAPAALLADNDVLTAPTPAATELLHALVLSAYLLTSHLGCPCSVRQAAELALLRRGAADQQATAVRAIHWIAANGPKGEDTYWIKARNEILWLRDWGADKQAEAAPDGADGVGQGVLGHVSRDFIEVEFLKALLTNTRYSLARALYEDDHPLPKERVLDTVFAAAMAAYDNASNPNRTRGGLKKCDDIIHAFPRTVDHSLPAAQRAEALVTATHAISPYRLVLKQGEPFSPVILRVHPDPMAILGKVLEQNPKSYTHIQVLVGVAVAMVDAGLPFPDVKDADHAARRLLAERRVTAMCIDAALNEVDFETAYSYVVGRVAVANSADSWSWRAALEAGKYRRSDRSVRPTHLGTSTANLDIRHLEQRIDCLAAALRIAPADTLQEILNAYRRCEEELDTALLADAERATAWDNAGDASPWQQQQQQMQTRKQQKHGHHSTSPMPGSFERPPPPAAASTPLASRAAAEHQQQKLLQPPRPGTTDDAPLSLFDLSRATARVAQRNFSALSSLRNTHQAIFGAAVDTSPSSSMTADSIDATQQHRKRDQLREAAMGTLTSGVGWLIGAHPVDRNADRE